MFSITPLLITLQPGWMEARRRTAGGAGFICLELCRLPRPTLVELGEGGEKNHDFSLFAARRTRPRRQEPDEHRGATSLLPEGEIRKQSSKRLSSAAGDGPAGELRSATAALK